MIHFTDLLFYPKFLPQTTFRKTLTTLESQQSQTHQKLLRI